MPIFEGINFIMELSESRKEKRNRILASIDRMTKALRPFVTRFEGKNYEDLDILEIFIDAADGYREFYRVYDVILENLTLDFRDKIRMIDEIVESIYANAEIEDIGVSEEEIQSFIHALVELYHYLYESYSEYRKQWF